MRKTKIICTLGPAVDSEDTLKELMLAGMNCARLNFSHGTHEEHQVRIDRVKKVRAQLERNVAILLDTKGPEIRVKDFEKGGVTVEAGDTFTLSVGDFLGTKEKVAVSYDDMYKYLEPGVQVLINDGHIVLKVEQIQEPDVICRVVIGGKILNHKGINIPNVTIPMPYLSERDKNDILFGIKNDVDFIAASFTRTAWDVIDLRQFLDSNGGENIKIISKIENASGIENLDEILKYTDGVMIARGDMGVEVDYALLPIIQKDILLKCFKKGIPVVTATQMLESMITNPIPTRAEVSDIATAVYLGTTIVMLSGETAAGKYPVEAVKTMSSVATSAEADIDKTDARVVNMFELEHDKTIASAISLAACNAAKYLDAAAILVVTRSGRTAQIIANYHPSCPVIAAVTSEKSTRQLALSRGVYAYTVDDQQSAENLFSMAMEVARKSEKVKPGDTVVIVAGGSVSNRAPSDMLKVVTL